MAIDPTTLRTELESLTRELSQLLRGAGTPRDNRTRNQPPECSLQRSRR